MSDKEKTPEGSTTSETDTEPADPAEERPRRSGGFAADRKRASLAGKRGAQTLIDRLGTEHFQRLGKRGGAAVKRKYGPEYYREIGKRGGRSRWDAEKARRRPDEESAGG
jgi:general stress protein YciG